MGNMKNTGFSVLSVFSLKENKLLNATIKILLVFKRYVDKKCDKNSTKKKMKELCKPYMILYFGYIL